MTKTLQRLILMVLFSLPLGSQAQAGNALLPDSENAPLPGSYSIQDLEDSVLRTTRLLQQKREQELLLENNPDARPVDNMAPETPQDFSSTSLFEAAGANPESSSIYSWLGTLQAQSPLGLFESYPQDGNLNQGFTYDQALAGIALLKENDTVAAKKILDFYKSRWDGTGFWTVYNTQTLNGFQIEYSKINGPNAWIALFALTYYKETGDSSALDLATNIGKWIASLPHQDGGIAMGANIPGNPNWGTIYSVENDLDDYALFNLLSKKAVSSADRALFKSEKEGIALWLKTKAFDSSLGLFKRGPGTNLNDNTLSLDTNTWAFSALGVDGLKELLGYDDQAVFSFIQRIENTFAVQANGTFGGNIFTAKGFDFAYSTNAAMIGRPGIVWVEGSNQMILVYKQLVEHYTKAQNVSEASKYQTRADYFLSLNPNYRTADNQSYFYSDTANAQVFWDINTWRTAPGPAVPSTAWVYFAVNGINPFAPFQVKKLNAPVQFSGSTSRNSTGDFTFSLDTDFQASVNYLNQTYSAYFDPDDLTLSFALTPASPGVSSENFSISLTETEVGGGDWTYSVASLDRLLNYLDSTSYLYGYEFFSDGSLKIESLLQDLGEHFSEWSSEYTYLMLNGSRYVDTQTVTTFFDGLYGYGVALDYAYFASGNVQTITVTQETRNQPLLRVLESYAYIFNVDGSLSFVYLGSQTVPLT